MPKNGFSLIELLVVIAIIAILASIAAVIINPLELTRRGRDTVRKKDIQAIADALESAYSSSGYPSMSSSMFDKEQVPFDPLADSINRTTTGTDCSGKICKYCVEDAGTPMSSAFCDSTTPAVDVGQPPAGTSFIICANLEKGGSFCLKNRQ